MTIQAFGERAILVNFEQKIDPAINSKVHQLTDQIRSWNLTGVEMLLPAYCSLTIFFEPNKISHGLLMERIKAVSLKDIDINGRTVRLPACYDEAFGLDMKQIMVQTGLTKQEIIQVHTSQDYLVYMIGFLPGFAYLGSVPKSLQVRRKEQIRLKVPALSIGLAGIQTGIYPVESAGGWQIVGRCAVPTFIPEQIQNPLLLAGDQVRFESIARHEYELIQRDVIAKSFHWDNLYE